MSSVKGLSVYYLLINFQGYTNTTTSDRVYDSTKIDNLGVNELEV